MATLNGRGDSPSRSPKPTLTPKPFKGSSILPVLPVCGLVSVGVQAEEQKVPPMSAAAAVSWASRDCAMGANSSSCVWPLCPRAALGSGDELVHLDSEGRRECGHVK